MILETPGGGGLRHLRAPFLDQLFDIEKGTCVAGHVAGLILSSGAVNVVGKRAFSTADLKDWRQSLLTCGAIQISGAVAPPQTLPLKFHSVQYAQLDASLSRLYNSLGHGRVRPTDLSTTRCSGLEVV